MPYSRVLLFRTDPSVQMGVKLLPCGMGILAEILEERGIEYDVLDMAIGYTEDDLMQKIEEFQPDLIGCSMISYLYGKTYDTLDRIRATYPEIAIAAGGPHVSTFRLDLMEKCQAVDYAFTLEGEESFFELIEGKPANEIMGVYFREDGEIKYLGDRKNAKDLSVFPWPKYSKFEIEKYTPLIPIYASRGCPYPCTFCAIGGIIGRKFRARPNEHVIDEIRWWYDQGIRKISFSDDNFTMIPDRVFDFCKLLEQEDFDYNELSFQVWDTRADSTSRELLVEMKKVGFTTLLIGVESGNDRVLKDVIKKLETTAEIERMVVDGIELGFDIRMSFIVGSPGDPSKGIPGESAEEVENSFKFALKHPIKGANFFNPVPTPMTGFLKVLEQVDALQIAPADYLNEVINTEKVPLFETPELSFKERERLLKKGRKVEHQIVVNYWVHKLGLEKFGAVGRLGISFLMNPLFNEYLYRGRCRLGLRRVFWA